MLTIAGIASAAVILNVVQPALTRSSGAVISASAKVDNRLKSDIEIVHTLGELNASSTFADTNGNAKFDIITWVKNIGTAKILSISQTDVFLGKTGAFVRVPHETEVGATTFPRWSFKIENPADPTVPEWDPNATLRITVTYDATQSTGNYDLKVVIPNGISDEAFFSL